MKKLFALSLILATTQFAHAKSSLESVPNYKAPTVHFSKLPLKDKLIFTNAYHMKTLNKEKQQQQIKFIQILATYNPTND